MENYNAITKIHKNLLEMERSSPGYTERVSAFIDLICRSGRQIRDPEQRDQLRSYLRFWTTVLYEVDPASGYRIVDLDTYIGGQVKLSHSSNRKGINYGIISVILAVIIVILCIFTLLINPAYLSFLPINQHPQSLTTSTPMAIKLTQPPRQTSTPTAVPTITTTPTPLPTGNPDCPIIIRNGAEQSLNWAEITKEWEQNGTVIKENQYSDDPTKICSRVNDYQVAVFLGYTTTAAGARLKSLGRIQVTEAIELLQSFIDRPAIVVPW